MRRYTVLATVLLIAATVSITPAQTWTVEQVTDNTEADLNPFVTAVSSGLMVVYTHNDGDDEVFIADNFSGSWTSSRITDNSRLDRGFDIAANYNEQIAHISLEWQDTPDGEISYCSGTPGSWNIERVTDNADIDVWPSLAIDGAGNIHMAYYKAAAGDREIFYANNATGPWVSEQVTDNTIEDAYPWLALDSDDNPNIVYIANVNLVYTKKTAGIWTTPEAITGGLAMTSFPFLALDADDNCHVSYSKNDGTDFEIYYANNVTGSWQEAKVTSNDYDDVWPTLVLDPNASTHIAYVAVEAADAEVFYANNTAGVWTTGRVTDNSVSDVSMVGRYFAIDQERIGHIFFWNNSDGDTEIYHAYSNSPLYAAVEETPQDISEATINIVSAPFSSHPVICYSIPSAGPVSLKIYDVSGNLVTTLVNETQSQGEYTVCWDGNTGEGIQVSSGVYFFNLIANGEKVSVKSVLK